MTVGRVNTIKIGMLLATAVSCDGIGYAIVGDVGTSGSLAGTRGTAAETASGSATAGEVDRDNDGVGDDLDCNDFNPRVFPMAPEIFDGFDNDCDGEIDEGLPELMGFVGYGSATVGGAGGAQIVVDSLLDTGPGTLREALEELAGPRMVTFAQAGKIQLQSPIKIASGYVTITGSSAPTPGVTIVAPPNASGLIIPTIRDVVITHVRFEGNPQSTDTASGHYLVEIDGETGQGASARRIVLDHLTFTGAMRSAVSAYGASEEVTLSYSLFTRCVNGVTTAGPNTRAGWTLYANAFLRNAERIPQLDGPTTVELVGNVIYDWSLLKNIGFGTRIVIGSGDVDANIMGNAYLETSRGLFAMMYGSQPGADGEEGKVANLGSLWVADNRFPDGVQDTYSTASEANATPASARVDVWPVADLADSVLPWAGMRYRTSAEKDLSGLAAAVLARD